MSNDRHHSSRGSRLQLRFLPLVAVLALLAGVPAIAPPAAAAPRPIGADKLPALASPARPVPPTGATGDASTPPPHEAQREALPSLPRATFDPARSVALPAETTATNKVFVNPDGSKTAEVSPRPVRALDPSGTWRDIDLALVAGADGRLGAKAAAVPATLAADAGATVATVETPAGPIGLRHPQSSAAPATLDKATATYKGALSGRDLVLSLTTDGVEETVVAPDAKGPPSYLDEFVLPAGVSARDGDSGIDLVDSKGEVVATFGGGMAFDAANAAAPVALRLVPTPAPEDGASIVTVDVSVDGTWFSDPARVFPISIDPLITTATNASVGIDTFGWQSAPTANYGAATELYTGNLSGGATQAFVRFDNLVVTPSPDVWVSESHLMLLGVAATDCTKPVNVQGISNTPNALTAATTWNTRPAPEGSLVSSTVLGASCASIWNSFDATSLVQRWLNASAPNYGLRVSANDEADAAAFKRFTSANTANPPLLYITYDHLPGASAPVSPPSGTVLSNPNTTLTSATATDGDGDAVQYWFRATTGTDAETGPKVVDSGWLPTPTYTVPVGSLTDGTTYYWHVITWDGRLGGPAGTYTYGQPPANFRVDAHMGTAADSVGPVSVDLASGNVSTAHASPALATVGGAVGLTYAYNSAADPGYGLAGTYSSYVPNGSTPPVVGTGTPRMTRTDPNVNFNWGSAGPGSGLADNFMVHWEGTFTPPRGGIPYTFYAAHDDGLVIKVNGVTILNSWRDQSTNSSICNVDTCGTTAVLSGVPVPIVIDYYEHSSFAYVTVGVTADIGVANASVTEALLPQWLTTGLAPLPPGWTFSPSAGYVSARVGETTAMLVDPAGAPHRWTANTPSGFSPPPGEDGVAGTDSAGAMTIHDGGVTSAFDGAGRLKSTNVANDDAHPTSVLYGWGGTPLRLRTLTDPVSGRVVTISYGGDISPDPLCPGSPPLGADLNAPKSMVCAVTYPDTTQTKLWYVNSQLARIEDPGAAVVEFAYAGGLLTKVRDPLAADAVAAAAATGLADDDTTRTIVHYDSGSRVDSVTLAVPTVGAPRPAHTYARPSASETRVHVTGLTEPAGYARAVIFDAAGRATQDRDALGRLTTTAWDGGDMAAAAGRVANRPLSVTDPAGRMSTAIFDTTGRPTDGYGPAPSSCFGTDRLPNGTCGAPVAHSAGVYDGTIPGLASMYWNGAGRIDAPKLHRTGVRDATVGDANGALLASWSSAPSGVTAPWSARFKGEITLGVDSNLQVRGAAGAANWGSATVWVDRVLLTTGTVSAGTHRITIDFDPGTAPSIELDAREAVTGTFATVAGTFLRPRYGLVTKTSIDDDTTATPKMVTDTDYGTTLADPDAATGLAAKTTVDRLDTVFNPAGLDLSTTFAYEAPGAGTFLRPISRTLPAGNATTYAYFGATDRWDVATPLGSNPCVGSTILQAGLRHFVTDPDPDGAGAQVAKVTEFAYDAMGRTAGSRIGAEAWSCVVRDGRGRVTSAVVAGLPSRTVSYNYAVLTGGPPTPNPLVTSISDPQGTITATTDLLGRIVSYVDATAHTTTTTYDQPGRVTDTSGPQGALHVVSDAAGRPVTQSLDGVVVATPSYTGPGGALSGVAYGNGSALGAAVPIARDQAGRTTGLTFTQTAGIALVADTVVRSQSGRVRDEIIDGTDANPLPHTLPADPGANFRYDGAGRLTDAWVGTQHLTYAFAATGGCGLLTTAGANSNRTSTATNGGTATTYCYDNADRLTSSSDASVGTPVYDAHGNTTTLGTQTQTYDPANRHMTTVAGTTNVTYVRDATSRIISRNENGTITGYGFAGPGDSPAFTTGALGIVVDRFVGLAGGVTVTKRLAADTWSYPNIHGDVVASANAVGIKQGGTVSYDPLWRRCPTGQLQRQLRLRLVGPAPAPP